MRRPGVLLGFFEVLGPLSGVCESVLEAAWLELGALWGALGVHNGGPRGLPVLSGGAGCVDQLAGRFLHTL